MEGAPPHVAGDYPEWLDPHLARVFGDERAEEGAALASRAPLDLRVNTLKADRDDAAKALADLHPEPTRWSPHGLRIRLKADAKSPAVHAEPAFLKGRIEIQDEGSQLAALFARAKPGEQVLDLCAGAGGKTLALAAAMENKGQLYATDDDKRRLAPIHDRLARAGARNVQVRTPKSVGTEIDDLAGRMDLVLIDAPCTGIGAWRRNPDAKWRVRPGALEQRIKEQAELLDRRGRAGEAGGRIAYVTCSVLAEENGDQVRAFLARHPEFSVEKPAGDGERSGRARLYVRQGGAALRRRAADDPAPHRHRRLFRLYHAAIMSSAAERLDRREAGASRTRHGTTHDKILIVDFGSQVTQLIARRVREEKVYCEIVPFQKAAEAFAAMKPTAVILSGGPASVLDKDAPLAPQGAVRRRRARCSASATASRRWRISSAARSRPGITANSAAPRCWSPRTRRCSKASGRRARAIRCG